MKCRLVARASMKARFQRALISADFCEIALLDDQLMCGSHTLPLCDPWLRTCPGMWLSQALSYLKGEGSCWQASSGGDTVRPASATRVMPTTCRPRVPICPFDEARLFLEPVGNIFIVSATALLASYIWWLPAKIHVREHLHGHVRNSCVFYSSSFRKSKNTFLTYHAAPKFSANEISFLPDANWMHPLWDHFIKSPTFIQYHLFMIFPFPFLF